MTEIKLYDASDDFIWLFLRPWIWIPRIIYISLNVILLTLRFITLSQSNSKEDQDKLGKYLLDTITKLGRCIFTATQ